MKNKKYNVAEPYFSNKDIAWIKKNIETVLRGQLSTGPYVRELEEKFAKTVGTKYALCVNTATFALEISVKALGLEEKDEVIIPAETFIATGMAVTLNGGKVVFGEVNPQTFCMDLDEIKKRHTKKTRGVILVHFGGNMSPDTIKIKNYCKRHRLFLIEDAAHSHGSSIDGRKAGSIGDTACFSFFPTKIMTMGEGGMLTTSSKKIYDFAKSLRERGRKIGSKVEIYDYPWRSGRVPEISAVLGINQLSNLQKCIEKRKKIANIYNQAFERSGDISALPEFAGVENAYWKHITLIENKRINRKRLAHILDQEYNVKINWAYDPPLHLQPVYQKIYGKLKGTLPITEDIMSRHFHLPMHVLLSQKDANYIAHSVLEAIEKIKDTS